MQKGEESQDYENNQQNNEKVIVFVLIKNRTKNFLQ